MCAKIAAAIAMILLGAAQANGRSPFDGRWRTDLTSLSFPKTPEDILLRDGVYSCRSCLPPVNIAADGNYRPLSGISGIDRRAVEMVDARTIRITDRNGDLAVRENVIRVSADGRRRQIAWKDITRTDAPEISGVTIQRRIGSPIAGAHAASGQWVTVRLTNVTNAARTETLKLEGGFLSMSRASGESYRASVDGPPSPYVGNPSISEVVVTRAGPRELVETSLYHGEVISILTRRIAADGKIQMLRARNPKTGAVRVARSLKL